MSPAEFIQLKAFARVDGVLLALVWTASFALCMAGFASPMLMMAGGVIAVCSPVFVWLRARRFRDTVLDGAISFLRAYSYVMLMFFYSAILFALVQFVYFKFIDQGWMISKMREMMSSEDGMAVMQAYGMTDMMNESLSVIAGTRPIDYALSNLTQNFCVGVIIALPLAALVRRRKRT